MIIKPNRKAVAPAGGGGGFLPTDIAMPLYWFRKGTHLKDNGSGGFTPVSANGDLVAKWPNAGSLSDATEPLWYFQPKFRSASGGADFTNDGDAKKLLLPSIATLTRGEAFIRVKKTTYPSAYTGGGLWWLGDETGSTSGDTYFADSTTVLDSFGAPARRSFTPTVGLDSFRTYHVRSTSANWTAWLDGVQQYTTASNTVSFAVATPYLGTTSATGNSLAGEIVEFVLWGNPIALDTGQIVNMEAYMASL